MLDVQVRCFGQSQAVDIDLRAFWVPLVHRYAPIEGPGGLARALSPLLHTDTSQMVHVTRYADVREVWERDQDFSVRVYGRRMAETTGEFLLGMSDPVRHAAEARILAQVIRRDDAARVARIAAEETERALTPLRGRGRLDVVKQLANEIPIRVVMRYFGLEGAAPSELLKLFQQVSFYIFSFWEDADMKAAALPAGARLKQLIADCIGRRRAAASVRDDDVLGRMLTMQERFSDGDAGIVRSIAGLCSGTLNAPMGLFVNVVDKLLKLSTAERAQLSRSVRGGDDPAASQRFRAQVLEAQRFGVFPGALHRHVERDSVIAAGTRRARSIPAGTTVVVWPSLAAFDEREFGSPFAFLPGRPSSRYMGFGHAVHRCLGEHVGQVMIEQMTKPLFALAGLRRSSGKAGTVQNGPVSAARFPVSFELRFEPH